MWQRRAFLQAAGGAFAASLLPGQAEALERAELVFATATLESPDHYAARILTESGRVVTTVALPVRGHDVTWSRTAGRAAVFARRPGTFAVVFDPNGHDAPATIASPAGRHFFGHGTFSPDGKLLYASENDFVAGRGVIGIYDVAGGYRRVGEMPSYGIGPHEVLLLPEGKTFVVANGGIETHPDYGRSELNLDAMDPSIALINVSDGSLIGQLRLDAGLRRLSIRHLAVDAKNRVWFGCQFRGDAGVSPQLVGYATVAGDIRLVELPADALRGLGGYVGGLAISRDGERLAVSSPVGGTVLIIDTASGQSVSATNFTHTCGVGTDTTGFVASNGLGVWQGLNGSDVPRQQFGFLFDEHLRQLA